MVVIFKDCKVHEGCIAPNIELVVLLNKDISLFMLLLLLLLLLSIVRYEHYSQFAHKFQINNCVAAAI